MGDDFEIIKIDTTRNLVFGWANVSLRKDGQQILDTQDHKVDIEELENAAYVFNIEYRASGEMHKGNAVGQMVESFVVTPEKLEKMGLAEDALPKAWWVGFYFEDDNVVQKVKDGTYKMFSIQGRAKLEREDA